MRLDLIEVVYDVPCYVVRMIFFVLARIAGWYVDIPFDHRLFSFPSASSLCLLAYVYIMFCLA